MAQAQVDLYFKHASCQTNENNEIYLYFANNKTGRLYYSTVFRERVLALNISASKSFIMNKTVWEKFKKCFIKIDQFFDDEYNSV